MTHLLSGHSDDGEPEKPGRIVSASFDESAVILDLSRPNGEPDDPEAARVFIEWHKGKGWIVWPHSDDTGYAGVVTLHDDQSITIGDSTTMPEALHHEPARSEEAS